MNCIRFMNRSTRNDEDEEAATDSNSTNADLSSCNVNIEMGDLPAGNANATPSQPAPLIDGYPSLATWIAEDIDHETFIFRRFRWLTARSLSYLQSELIHLEIEIKKIDELEDLDSLVARRSWKDFQREDTRKKLMKKINLKLGQYRKWPATLCK